MHKYEHTNTKLIRVQPSHRKDSPEFSMISFLLTLRLTLSERKNTITDVGSTATYSKMDRWTAAYLDIKSNKTNSDNNDIDDDSGAVALNVIRCECCDTVSKGILT